jgi:hypothetical protein
MSMVITKLGSGIKINSKPLFGWHLRTEMLLKNTLFLSYFSDNLGRVIVDLSFKMFCWENIRVLLISAESFRKKIGSR